MGTKRGAQHKKSMKYTRIFCFGLMGLATGTVAYAQSTQESQAALQIHTLFSDGAVLQQDSSVPVWGWGTPGSDATVRLIRALKETAEPGEAGESAESPDAGEYAYFEEATTTVQSDGTWMLSIRVPKAVPYDPDPSFSMIVTSGSDTLHIQNLLAGEVWLASGQSNMEMPLRGWPPTDPILNSEAVIASAKDPHFRMFTVERKAAMRPPINPKGNWAIYSTETAPDFSATATFFALRLREELGVPVGILHSSWGGTPAESWTPLEDLRTVPGFESLDEEFERAIPAMEQFETWLKGLEAVPVESLRLQNPSAPFEGLDLGDLALADPSHNDSAWVTIPVPSSFESHFGEFDGVIWFRTSFFLTDGQRAEILSRAGGQEKTPDSSPALALHLGPIDDMDVTYLNGAKIGGLETEGNWQVPRVYSAPASLLRVGENHLAVRVLDTQGGGGIFGSNPVELRLGNRVLASLKSPWKAKPVALIRDHQIYRFGEGDQSFDSMPDVGLHLNQYTGSLLFNGMIAPLVPYAIRGVIWYQGESNVGRGEQYETLFPAMIRSWRRAWATNERVASERVSGATSIGEVPNSEMPFYYVQIAPYNYDDPTGNATAELREAQRKTMTLPSTGMVVSTDIGNPVNIHPANKQAVGERLARWALADRYGMDLDVSGPLVRKAMLEHDQIRIWFDFAENGLMSSDDTVDGMIHGFEVVDTAGNLWPVEGVIKGSEIVINWDHSDATRVAPAEVRFGWTPAPESPLFDQSGLPASPFRITVEVP